MMNRSVADPVNVHASCVALTCAELTMGVLLMGPSGCGKSSLALSLIDQSGSGIGSDAPITARLVSDDQVLLTEVDGDLMASAPKPITGLLEVRGIGIVQVQTARSPMRVDRVVSHAAAADQERVPDTCEIELAGCNLPLHKIDFVAASAAAYIRVLAQMQWGLTSSINR